MSLEAILLWAAAVGYLLATGLAGLQLLRTRPNGERWVMLALALGILPHGSALVVRAIEISAFPIASVHDGVNAFSFLAGIIALTVAWRAIPQVALLASPLLAMLTVVAAVVPSSHSVPEGLRSAWLGVHIGLALLGDAMIAVAGVVSIVYLVHERRLKHKKGLGKQKIGTGLHNLPALEVLDRVSMQLIKFGFPLMTLGLLSGSLYGKQVWGHYWTWDPRNTISLLVWVLYAVMLHARLMIGWRGRKAAILTVVGVIAILLAFVGLGILGVGTHGKDYVS